MLAIVVNAKHYSSYISCNTTSHALLHLLLIVDPGALAVSIDAGLVTG